MDQRDLAKRLSPMQFRVTQDKATEPPFSHPFNRNKKDGTYRCICCDAVLFASGTKFDSGSGWPSFWAPHSDDAVRTVEDRSHGMQRTEIVCARCGAHLGHVFDDGPDPTGQRFCVNGSALDFEPTEPAARGDR